MKNLPIPGRYDTRNKARRDASGLAMPKMCSDTLKDKSMGKEILRRIEDDYYDYDGDEDEEIPDDYWDLFNESFNW